MVDKDILIEKDVEGIELHLNVPHFAKANTRWAENKKYCEAQRCIAKNYNKKLK